MSWYCLVFALPLLAAYILVGGLVLSLVGYVINDDDLVITRANTDSDDFPIAVLFSLIWPLILAIFVVLGSVYLCGQAIFLPGWVVGRLRGSPLPTARVVRERDDGGNDPC